MLAINLLRDSQNAQWRLRQKHCSELCHRPENRISYCLRQCRSSKSHVRPAHRVCDRHSSPRELENPLCLGLERLAVPQSRIGISTLFWIERGGDGKPGG